MSTIESIAPHDRCQPPSGDESIYERIRADIVEGRLAANERLKVSQLAAQLGTSTNPVREALQQLRGEGFVIIEPNRGARVRPIDEKFVRDIFEIEELIEPALTRWFVGAATRSDVEELDRLQEQIEELNFADEIRHSELDFRFHSVMYARHYNRRAVELWELHRNILSAIGHGVSTSLSRQAAAMREHRQLLACIKQQDADGAVRVIVEHVRGSGQHIIDIVREVAKGSLRRK